MILKYKIYIINKQQQLHFKNKSNLCFNNTKTKVALPQCAAHPPVQNIEARATDCLIGILIQQRYFFLSFSSHNCCLVPPHPKQAGKRQLDRLVGRMPQYIVLSCSFLKRHEQAPRHEQAKLVRWLGCLGRRLKSKIKRLVDIGIVRQKILNIFSKFY